MKLQQYRRTIQLVWWSSRGGCYLSPIEAALPGLTWLRTYATVPVLDLLRPMNRHFPSAALFS